MAAKQCIGYGEREGVCTNPAGTPWGPLWCLTCDRQRLDTISRQMAEISASFKAGEQDRAAARHPHPNATTED